MLTRLAADDVWARFEMARRLEMSSVARPWHIDRDMHGRVEACDVGSVRLARMRANPLCIEQTNSFESLGVYKLLLQLSGRSLLQQAGREVMLTAGFWTLYKGAVPFSLMNLERSEQRMVVIPQSDLGGLDVELDSLIVRRFGASDHSSWQLVSLLDSAFETAAMYGKGAATELAFLATHLARLALIEATGAHAEQLCTEVMRNRINRYIDHNLRDPSLSLEGVAVALNCSKRYLHKVFAHQDVTIGQYILNRRLERCLLELNRGPTATRSIAELAYSWGFNSLSYFGKAFARRYGMTPTQCRAAGVVQDDDLKRA